MDRKILCLIIALGLFLGCTDSVRQGRELHSYGNYTNLAATLGGENDLVFNPSEVEAALPAITDLPVPATLKRDKRANQYTGIIKNKTNYEVSVPSGNSGSTIIIPAKGWIEYPAWGRRFDVTAYHDGKPFYCLKINVQPKNYAFMCKKYDFMVEIVKAEPKKKPARKKKMKRAVHGVEAYG
jgi:hypothetical protein